MPEWKEIKGYEGYYEISSDAQIRRIKAGDNTWAGRILKQSMWGKYRCVTLCMRGSETRFHVHYLMAINFVGPTPNWPGKKRRGFEINHKDGNKLNNCPDNLEYVTPSQQRQHAVDTGLLRVCGEDSPRSKLTAEQVREIRVCGGKIRDVAKVYGVTHRMISLIRRNLAWRTVK